MPCLKTSSMFYLWSKINNE